MVNVFIVLLFIGTVFSAYAERCTTVDLRNTPSGRAMGPVRNQGRMPWCTAYVLADMMSFKNRECYSALAMGINYTSDDRGSWWDQIQQIREGRNMITANHWYNFSNMLNGNRGKNMCLESDLPSDDNGAHQVNDLLVRIGEIRNQVGFFGNCSEEQMNIIRSMFPNLSPREIQLLMGSTLATNIHRTLMEASCRRHPRRFPDFRPRFSQDLNVIDQQLSAGYMVGVTYSSNILKNPAPPPNKQGHISSIIGRRMRAGKCEYLLRNSWGRGCGGYLYPCEEGNIWVPEDRLKGATGGVWAIH